MNDRNYEKEIENLNKDATRLLEKYKEKSIRIDKAIKIINKALCPNSDYVDYDYGSELLRQELLEILQGSDKE